MVLRTAVIGAGIVSENNHLPALDRNPRTDLAAVCDLDGVRPQRVDDETDHVPGRVGGRFAVGK